MEEYLAIDVGGARVGIARGSMAARLAEPLVTVPAEKSMEAIMKLSAEHRAAAIVVGLPRNLQGQDTDQTRLVRQWVERLKDKLDLPVFWQDEALTSHAAEKAEHPAGPDAVAAAMILQDFLDSRENDRVAA